MFGTAEESIHVIAERLDEEYATPLPTCSTSTEPFANEFASKSTLKSTPAAVSSSSHLSTSSGSFCPCSASNNLDDLATKAIGAVSIRTLQGPAHAWHSHSHRVVIDCYPWVSVLEPLMNNAQRDSPLHMSTLMLARAYLVNRRMLQASKVEENRIRGICLASVRSALANPTMATKDATIMAVWLLGTYEVLQGSIKWPPDKANSWGIHQTGLVSLITARGIDQFKTAQGRQIFWLCVESVQIYHNATSQPCSASLLAWLHRLKRWKLSKAENLVLAGAFLSARVSELYPHMREVVFSNSPEFAAAAIPALVAETNSIEQEYAAWAELALDPDLLAQARSQYKLPVCRMKLHNFLVYCINLGLQAGNFSQSLPEAELRSQRHQSMMLIQDIAEQLLETAPPTAITRSNEQALGHEWTKKMAMMYPFASICHMQTPRLEQRVRAREVLKFIGRECGILQALRPSMGTQMPERASRGMPDVKLVGEEGIPLT
ncbi:hypothetical protein BROUX41_006655 [Berkeleyomyces rouxiae]|uniref:uncharacterized protein n=1 Tax=Berkeleyomyces rouxiae TaxID=2035830 RepID=UPI003B82A204